MVKSMTGYGKGEQKFEQRTITVELKSVNNRYLDCNIRIPRLFLFVEDQIKKTVQKSISRGKVDLFVSIEEENNDQVDIHVNTPVASGYFHALNQLAKDFSLRDDISVSLLTRFPDVLIAEKKEQDEKQVAQAILSVLSDALTEFDAMRAKEGNAMKRDILSRADAIEQMVQVVDARSPETVTEYRNRLETKMQEVLSNTHIDEGRILTEAAIYADKIAVSEETVRLKSHLSQLREMLSAGGTIGRKLDFLVQEIHREVNTIGSKCNDITLTRLVVDMKAEIEKIREQIQNIE